MKIRWTLLAVEDLGSIHDYISATSPAAARLVIQRTRSALESLKSYPSMGRMGRVEGTRELVVPATPFIVVYRVTKARIEILAIIHGARRWPESF